MRCRLQSDARRAKCAGTGRCDLDTQGCARKFFRRPTSFRSRRATSVCGEVVVQVQTFAPIVCPSCGKRFRWKPEFAGRSVKCPCGTVISIAAEPAHAPQPPDEDTYDFAAS